MKRERSSSTPRMKREGAHAPVAAPRGVVGEHQLGREVAIEGEALEVGGRQDAEVLDHLAPHQAPADARVFPAGDLLRQVEKGDLALVHHRGAERPERPLQTLAREAEEDLGERRASDRDVDAGEALAQHVGERVRRLDLPREGHREADQADPLGAEPIGEQGEVIVEGVALGARVAGDLVGGEQGERGAVGHHVEGQRGVGRAHHPERGVDGGDGRLVGGGLVKALTGPIAEDGDRVLDRPRDGGGVAAGAPELGVDELLGVGEDGPPLQLLDAPLDDGGERLQRLGPEQVEGGLQVGVDGEDLDPVPPEPGRERGHREVRRGGVARRGIDEGDAHAGSEEDARIAETRGARP
jgi:hypothetical protein